MPDPIDGLVLFIIELKFHEIGSLSTLFPVIKSPSSEIRFWS